MATDLKKTIVVLLKFGVPIGIIGWLLASVPEESYRQLEQRPKDWTLLVLALGLVFAAVSVTFVRWHLLVRTLRLEFRLLDAFRLGFLGFLFNFVSAGAVGGDLFKAFFIARQQPKRRAEAIATVVVDRMVGLYALLLLTSGVILASNVSQSSPQLRTLSYLTLSATAFGGIAVLTLLVPGFTNGVVSRFLIGLPRIGEALGRLILAVRIYRQRWRAMVIALFMSVGTHGMFALALFLIARALYEHIPTVREHLIIVPLSMVAGALPFTPAGFGAFEFALEKLYQIVPAADNISAAGVLVALVYRLLQIVVAAIGMLIYWSSRSEVRQLIEDAEHSEEEALPDPQPESSAAGIGHSVRHHRDPQGGF
ncbi:MAG: lysylphosphatidylglycerol synthase transmembrane domain-containing protein [Planctomycetota bacterium]